MDINVSMDLLQSKDTTLAYEALKDLELQSSTSNAVYPYCDTFVSMLNNEKYVIRVRGFRLLCKQAQWDVDKIIDAHLDEALGILNDEKPTAVRQALAALHDVVPYKNNLLEEIQRRVLKIDFLRYKDTMHSLIEKDIEDLLRAIKEA